MFYVTPMKPEKITATQAKMSLNILFSTPTGLFLA